MRALERRSGDRQTLGVRCDMARRIERAMSRARLWVTTAQDRELGVWDEGDTWDK